MKLASQIAKHFRDLHFGGNWTSVNLKDAVSDLTWKQAVTKIESLNSIAALVFHMNYFVSAVLNVLRGNNLDAHDKYSFDLPAIGSEADWQKLLDKVWREAEEFATLVEQLPDSRFEEYLADEKYGNYYRNIHGIIEHMHYRLGQIVVIRKLIVSGNQGGDAQLR